MEYNEERVRELLTKLASTGKNAQETFEKLGIDVELRFCKIMRIEFDNEVELSEKDREFRDRLKASYYRLVEDEEYPRIYDWMIGAL